MKKIQLFSKSDLAKKIEALDTDCVIVVVEKNIVKFYPNLLQLSQINKKLIVWESIDGEDAKSFKQLEVCLDFCLERKITRNSILLAIGGGAITDFGGLVASLLLRGIQWIAVPTTLLGMVDAAIGGKTAINSRWGKNLVGTFHPPFSVWIDQSFLETLPAIDLLSGKGEILKYAFLSPDICKLVGSTVEFGKLIQCCAEFKAQLVKIDLYEQGVRKSLNFGHTIGHAIEKFYGIPHGIAVIWGILIKLHLFAQEKDVQDFFRIAQHLGINGLSLAIRPEDWSKISVFIERDKKNQQQQLISMVQVENFQWQLTSMELPALAQKWEAQKERFISLQL